MKKSAGILALIMMLGALAGCQSQAVQAPELLEPVGVMTDSAVVQYSDIYDVTVYGGEIVPYVEELYFEVDGSLDEVYVSIGDTVEAGQLLATLDSEALLEEIEALQDQIDYAKKTGDAADRQAEIKVEIAKLELKGLEEDLEVEKKTIRAKELEIEQLEIDREQAQQLRQLSYDKLVAQLAELQEDLNGIEIIAPFSGTVVYTTLSRPGAGITAFTPIVSIADENQLNIVSKYIPEYTMNGADQIYAQVLDKQYEITYVPMELEAYLEKVLSGADLTTTFSVERTDDVIRSGLYAAVTIVDNYKENVLVIPSNSLYRDEKGYYVYRLIDGERVRQDIGIGITTALEVEIIEGLQEGDVIYVKE